MKILATVILGVTVLIAALVFLSCSICAVSTPGQGRAIAVVFAVISLAVMIGGIAGIAAVYKSKEPRERM